jgi:hypothetical protein
MQVARYWRMKKHNYRLEGIRYTNGAIRVQARPTTPEEESPVVSYKHDAEAVTA